MSMASFWAELKKRKVIRAALVYVVVAWLVIQIADVVAPALLLPDWVARLVTFLLILGFPIAIVLAWAYDLTPEGIRLTPATEDGEEDGVRADAVEPSIAVLPFKNNSPDPDNEYFGDGLAEELLNTLSRLRGWRVAAQTSCFHFKGRNETIQTIGRELGVTTVLEGSVRASENRLKVSAQLINVADGYQTWSGTYTHERSDILAMQDEIARAIVAALKGEVFADERTGVPSTSSNAAYERYLRGRFLWQQRDAASIAEGIALLREAVSEDPSFADAYAALAAAYHKLPLYDPEADAQSTQQQAEAAAERALELSPESGEAAAIMGSILAAGHRFNEAGQHFARALETAPGSATAQHWYAIFLANTGRERQARDYAQAAERLDPLNGAIVGTLGEIHFALGNIDASLEHFEKARRYGWTEAANAYLGMVHLYRGNTGEAGEYLRQGRFEAEGIPSSFVDALLAAAGNSDDPALTDLITSGVADGSISTSLAFRLSAMTGLSTLFDLDVGKDLSVDALGTLWHPPAAAIRRDPRFGDLVEQLGLAALWRGSSWADACRAAGDRIVCE